MFKSAKHVRLIQRTTTECPSGPRQTQICLRVCGVREDASSWWFSRLRRDLFAFLFTVSFFFLLLLELSCCQKACTTYEYRLQREHFVESYGFCMVYMENLKLFVYVLVSEMVLKCLCD